MTLSVETDNPRTEALYLRLGFVVTGETDKSSCADQRRPDDLSPLLPLALPRSITVRPIPFGFAGVATKGVASASWHRARLRPLRIERQASL